jgi:transposase InsO family protein
MDSVLDMARAGSPGSASGRTTTRTWPTGRWPWRWRSAAGPCRAWSSTPTRAAEYTARAFRRACQRLGICQSTGRPGSALDNAVIEAWHSTLESGLRSLRTFAARAQARAAVAAWIEDCNHVRHSALGMVSPVDYERALAGTDAA